jgi:hypothetical protein
MTTRGFLAFRSEDGKVTVKEPVTFLWLKGKKIKYIGTSLTKSLKDQIEAYVEAEWGKKLEGDVDWNQLRAERRARGEL